MQVVSGQPIIYTESVNYPSKRGVGEHSQFLLTFFQKTTMFMIISFIFIYLQLILQFNVPSFPLDNMHNVQ